jgi:predicted RNA-binding protein with EMAP domain
MSKEKALKLINEYLAKQEPKKIELNMVKSVESNSKKSESLYTQGVKKIFSAISEIQSAIQTLEKSKDIANKSLNEGKELEKLADNIGAELKSSTTSAIQNAFNTINAAEQSIKDLKKAKSVIN